MMKEILLKQIKQTKATVLQLQLATEKQVNNILKSFANKLLENIPAILNANGKDIAALEPG